MIAYLNLRFNISNIFAATIYDLRLFLKHERVDQVVHGAPLVNNSIRIQILENLMLG
jgi:hypothetical protein